eukprot:6941098-Prymnesium_polylepis.1
MRPPLGVLTRSVRAWRVLFAHAAPEQFTQVGGRSVHDHSLVAAGEWREFPFFGSSTKYQRNCALCPMTTWVMEQVRIRARTALAASPPPSPLTLSPHRHAVARALPPLTLRPHVDLPNLAAAGGHRARGCRRRRDALLDSAAGHAPTVRHRRRPTARARTRLPSAACLLYTSDAADDM